MEKLSPVPVLNATVRKRYNDKSDRWELASDCVVVVESQTILIRQGFVTDFASTPWWCPNWLVPRSGRSAMPALAHDFLYERSGVPRSVADRTFHQLLKEAGVPFWQRNLMVNYVRLLGWLRYRYNQIL